MRGKLIVFEGIDSSGKATQCELLIEELKARGFEAEGLTYPRYSEHFGSLVGKYLAGEFGSLEEVPEEFAVLLYSIDRYQQKKEIEKKLAEGKILVSNRYSFSNVAFHSAKFSDKKQQKAFAKWITAVESRMPRADRVFFLDVPVSIAYSKMGAVDRKNDYRRGKDRDLHESSIALQERARSIYLELAHKNKNWIVINCASNSALKPKEEIAREILEEAEKFLQN